MGGKNDKPLGLLYFVDGEEKVIQTLKAVGGAEAASLDVTDAKDENSTE